MMSIFFSGCMLAGKLPNTLMHAVIIPLLKCKSKDPSDVNNYRPSAIATALSKVLEQVLLSRLARYLWTADSQFGFKQAHGTEIAIFALRQTVDFYCKQDTNVYMCFLDAKMAFDGVNKWTLAKKLLDRYVSLHIAKLFIFWYREQEFMVRWGNSLAMTFRCSNGIRQGEQLSPLLYNEYTDDLNNHLQATGVWCYVGGAWVNSLSYADDMVLLAPTVTALQTLLEVCCAYAGPHDIVYKQRKQYVCWSGQSNYSVGSQQESASEMRNETKEFRYLGHIMTADCRDDKDIKKIRIENAIGNMMVKKFSFAPIEAKIKLFKSYCYPIYGCALWHHSFQNSTIRKLTVTHYNICVLWIEIHITV